MCYHYFGGLIDSSRSTEAVEDAVDDVIDWLEGPAETAQGWARRYRFWPVAVPPLIEF